MNRASLLEKLESIPIEPTRNDLRIIGQYDTNAPEVREILSKYWGLLLLDQDALEILPPRPLITYRKGRSLKDRLIRSHFMREQPVGKWLGLDRKPLGLL